MKISLAHAGAAVDADLLAVLVAEDELVGDPLVTELDAAFGGMLRGAIKEAAQVESPRLRAAILVELRRLDPSVLPDRTRPEVMALLADLPVRLTSAAPLPSVTRAGYTLP